MITASANLKYFPRPCYIAKNKAAAFDRGATPNRIYLGYREVCKNFMAGCLGLVNKDLYFAWQAIINRHNNSA
jgi:hypothetical protein